MSFDFSFDAPLPTAMGLLIALGRAAGRIAAYSATVAMLALQGCATHYVDGHTPELPSAAYVRPAQPHPVQVVFEFRSRGVPSAQGTGRLRERAIDQVRESGLFSRVDIEPSQGAGLLALSLDNVPDPDESPTAKGIVTGATMFLVKSFVVDRYVCIARYVAADGSAPIEKSARHAIHSSIGAIGGAPPAGSTQARDVGQALAMVLKQSLSQVLDALSRDPDFK